MVFQMVDGRQEVAEGRIVVAFANPDYDSVEPYKSFEQEWPEEDICAYYAFETPKAFLEKWRELVNDPDGMWYWVIDDGNLICSGACDPGDIEIFEEHFELDEVFSAYITELHLSPQTFKCLLHGHVDTIGKLFVCSDEELLGMKNLGPGRLAEIKEKFEGFWGSYEGFNKHKASVDKVLANAKERSEVPTTRGSNREVEKLWE